MIEKIGKYEIVEKIGVGGFGIVYKGRDPFIKRTVAIKTCQSEDEEIKKRFFREAELSGNLQHRNITTIYDFGVEEGIPFIVQEYLTGEDLDKMIKRGEFIPLARKIEILLGICEGLAYAHESGIIHRDMKPSNVRILEDGSVKIMDFGIAKSFQSESNLTQTGITLGTAAYLAPEQIRGESVDPRTDIFSLGVLSYELLTYQKPFRGEHISTVLFKILNEKPDPVSRPGLALPQSLERLVSRCIEKDPSGRYSRVEDLRRDLAAVLNELPGAEGSGPPPRRPARETATSATIPRLVPPPLPGAPSINVTPPSGMLARSSTRHTPPADSTPTPGGTPRPRTVSLELVDFRNPSASESAAPPHSPPTFHVTEERSRAPLFIGLLLLAGAVVASVLYFQSRHAEQAPAPPARQAAALESTTAIAPGSSSGPAAAPGQALPATQSSAPSPAPAPSATPQPETTEPAREKPEAVKPEAPPPARKLAITFTTTPAATLFVDGKQIGETVPKKVVTLAEGRHSYRLEMEDGGAFEEKITVGKGERTSYFHRWPVGSLLVSAGPAWIGARVLVDGRLRGTLPVHGYLLLSPGAHEIAVSKDGLPPFLKTVPIAEGKRQELAVPAPEKM